MTESRTVPGRGPRRSSIGSGGRSTDLAVEIPSWGFVNTGHAVPGFPADRRAARRIREGRRRRDGRPLHGDRQDRGAPHPVGHRRRLRGTCRVRVRAWHPDRRHQLEHVPGRGLQARLAVPSGRPRPAQGDRRDRPLLRDRSRDGLRHREGLAVGRDQLPRPGRLPGAPPTADRGPARGLRGLAGQRTDGPRVQALRAGVLPHRCPGLGPVAVGLRAPRRAGARSASTPATTRWP